MTACLLVAFSDQQAVCLSSAEQICIPLKFFAASVPLKPVMGQDLYPWLLEEKRLQGWAEVQREEPLSQAVFDEELVLTGSFSTASRSRA